MSLPANARIYFYRKKGFQMHFNPGSAYLIIYVISSINGDNANAEFHNVVQTPVWTHLVSRGFQGGFSCWTLPKMTRFYQVKASQ